MASGIDTPRNVPIYYVYPRVPDHTLVFKNNESATCGFNIAIFGVVRGTHLNVVDAPDSWQKVSHRSSTGQK